MRKFSLVPGRWHTLALSLLLSACGGDTSGGGSTVPTCSGAFDACGGDVVGTWRYESICLNERPARPAPSCGVIETEAPRADVGGTIEISADGTIVGRTTGSTSQRVTYPVDCLSGSTCAEVEEALNEEDPDENVRTSATCTEVGDSCQCDVTVSAGGERRYTYVVEGSRIVVTDDEGDVDESTFCQQGDTLVVDSDGGRTMYRRE